MTISTQRPRVPLDLVRWFQPITIEYLYHGNSMKSPPINPLIYYDLVKDAMHATFKPKICAEVNMKWLFLKFRFQKGNFRTCLITF